MMLLRRRATPPSEPAEFTVSTLVLTPAMEALAWRPAPRVLDLGPAVAANVEFCTQVGAQVHVADLHGAFLDPEIPPADRTDWQQWLPEADTPFDLILAWDLLNYLNPKGITGLARALAPHCQSGTLLAAWISIRDPLPARPGRHGVEDRTTLRITPGPVTAPPRPSPRYRELQLVRWLEGFTVRQAFLMRHGVQEYLFTYPSEPNPEPSVPATPARMP